MLMEKLAKTDHFIELSYSQSFFLEMQSSEASSHLQGGLLHLVFLF